MPHEPEMQLGVPFGTVQVKPQLPQLFTSLFRFVQTPGEQYQRNGALQLNEQLTPSQFGVAFAGAVQFVQVLPHSVGSDAR